MGRFGLLGTLWSAAWSGFTASTGSRAVSHGPPSPAEGVGSTGIPSDATVTVLIPAYNEEARIAATVRAAEGIPRVACVMVVDDGSQDNTSEAAREAGAHRVVTMPRNRGKGAALNAGCVGLQSEILLLLDADLGETAAEGSRLLQPVLSGEADMTIATLPPSGSGGGFGLTVNLARWGIRRLGGSEMSAPLSGQRCLTRAVLDACGGFEAGF